MPEVYARGPKPNHLGQGVHSADSQGPPPLFHLLDSPMEDFQARLQISVEGPCYPIPRGLAVMSPQHEGKPEQPRSSSWTCSGTSVYVILKPVDR
ncbi:hypothetical protein INR49_001374 [Caranx melampygus]|nr:hypothetical protein INR49_001374 [Caranx melampygus]